MASFNKFYPFVANVANGKFNLGSDTLKIALFTGTTAPTNTDATYDDTTNYTLNSSGATELATGSGYTRNGLSVGSVTSSQSGGVYKLLPASANACTWTATTTISNIRYAVLYDASSGSAGARDLIGWWDYGSALTLNSGDSFTVQLDTTNGIFQLQ